MTRNLTQTGSGAAVNKNATETKKKTRSQASAEWLIDTPAEPEHMSRIQEINRKLILEAALEVFSTYGLRGSTLDQIAQKAGMSKPNLLYYFRRKEDIYVTVLQQTLEAWECSLGNIDPNGDPIEELSAYIRAKVEMAFREPAASRLFANEILQGAPMIGTFLSTDMRRKVDQKALLIGQWMEEGKIAKSDPYHLIFCIWAVAQHYSDFEIQIRAVLGSAFDTPDSCETSLAAINAILLNGIRPR